MKKHEFVSANVTLGGKKVGELIVSVEMADDLRFNSWLPDEPELKDKNFLFLRCGEFLLRTKNLPS